MTSIFIHGIDTPADLVCALAAVTEAFSFREAYEVESHTFTKRDPATQLDPELAEGLDALPAEERLEPEPLEPCPQRGAHERLTDCWLCWSDVMRGAALETDVLRTSWDTALARLADHAEDDR